VRKSSATKKLVRRGRSIGADGSDHCIAGIVGIASIDPDAEDRIDILLAFFEPARKPK
jgi:hypothetical protein